MHGRYPTLALLLLVAPAPDISAQTHLEPERGSINESDLVLTYVKSLTDVLLKDAAFHYRARVICLPSFEPAWVVTLVSDAAERPTFFVDFAVLEGGPEVPIEKSGVRKARARLDREIAESVQEVWLRMLRGVRYSGRPTGGGADGVTYHFSRFVPFAALDPKKAPPGWEAGMIWTLAPRTATAQLAGLGVVLKEYALAQPEKRLQLWEDIRARIRRLLDDLDQIEKGDVGVRNR